MKRLLVLGSLALAGCGDDGDSPVQSEEAVPVIVPVFDDIHISSVESAEHFQHASTTVDFGSEEVARATLSLSLGSPCFPFDNWTTETVPAGHNFPTLCDAYDRTFLWSLDDPSNPDEGPPGIELLRAITPFGGPLSYEADITDVVNGLLGSHELHVDIQTWGDGAGQVSGAEGEWTVSARIVLDPGPAPRKVLAVVPLVFGTQTEAESEPVPFRVPDGTTSARLEYRTTGHGGADMPDDAACIGPAEEFCERHHTLSLDGTAFAELDPWRTDCAALCTLTSYESDLLSIPSYCAENPTGLPASVRAPRANWCPGSITPPFVLDAPGLAVPGDHELSIGLDALAEGGQWLQSAVYYAYE